MEDQLKQRVIGAVVLTALAVIVLPMLLDGSAEERARVTARIPEPPPIIIERINVEEVEREMAELVAASETELPPLEPEEEPADPAPEALQLDNNNLPVGWSLQLGSFRNEENALKLRESLRDDLYRAYITRIDTDAGASWRVLVGPMLQREKLERIATDIEASYQLKGRVVRYRIEDDAGQLGG